MPKIKACIKEDVGRVALTQVDIPDPGPGEALIRTTLTTICGSDLHIRDHIPEVPAGMPMGHEGIGVVEAAGAGVERFAVGDRVVASCLASCGTCAACVRGQQCVCETFGAPFNLVFGAQGEAFIVKGADHSMARLPDGMDEGVALMTSDILSTGIGAIERGGVKAGDTVAIFAQGPVGLCATIGAKLAGAEQIITIESVPERVAMSKKFGATTVLAPDGAAERLVELTAGSGVDVAVEALGTQETFESCCRATRHGGTVSSVGVYGGVDRLSVPTDGTFIHRTIVMTFCPAGTARLEYLLGLIEDGRIDPSPLLTHNVGLDEIVRGYEMFAGREDGCVKLAIAP